jgi:HSP20 family protein
MAETATKLPIRTEKKSAAAPATKAESWAPFESLRQEVDRLFDEFRPFGWRSPFARPSRALELAWPRFESWQVAPAMDLAETDGEYEITAELPGLDEKNIDIKLSNGTLTIKGEKSEEKEEKDKEYYLSERRYGSFQRSFQIPEGVDADKIAASFAKGVLTVKLPKTAEAKKGAKKIEVKAA